MKTIIPSLSFHSPCSSPYPVSGQKPKYGRVFIASIYVSIFHFGVYAWAARPTVERVVFVYIFYSHDEKGQNCFLLFLCAPASRWVGGCILCQYRANMNVQWCRIHFMEQMHGSSNRTRKLSFLWPDFSFHNNHSTFFFQSLFFRFTPYVFRLLNFTPYSFVDPTLYPTYFVCWSPLPTHSSVQIDTLRLSAVAVHLLPY